MLTTQFLQDKFVLAMHYAEYVSTGQPHEQANWRSFHSRLQLTENQRDLIRSFVREINVLVLSGIWCGDCVQQCPFLDVIAAQNPDRIRVRFLDRDQHPDLATSLKICGGSRVPVAIFMNEDYEFVSVMGDRTLARYRAIATQQLGISCPLPGALKPASEVAAELQDWLDEFERVHLLLRLSTKLRQRHHD